VVDQGSSRRQPTRIGRKSFLVMTLCCSIAAGVTLLNIGIALSDPGVVASTSGPVAANEQLVRDFYAAVNDTIRTGKPGKLNTIVAPNVAWCLACPGQSPTRESLKNYLVNLHRTAPETRLVVDSVVAGFQDMVTVHVNVSGYPLVGDPVPWGPVDTIHIDGGLIARRLNGPKSVTLTDSLLRTQFDALPPAVNGIAMARLFLPVGSSLEGLLSPGPTVLVVESGAIAVRSANDGRIVRTGAAETSMGDDFITLHQGDAAIIRSGVRHTLRQAGMKPAVALGVTLYYVASAIDRLPGRQDLTSFVSPDRSGTPTMAFATVHYMANGDMGEWPAGPVSFSIGRVILTPGARMTPSSDNSLLVAVDSGALGISGEEESTTAAGDGMLLPAGTAREFRNAGNVLTVLLVLSISQASA
jgi:SnoaL-like domain